MTEKVVPGRRFGGATRLRNKFVIHRKEDGRFIAHAWPKKRGNNPSAAQAQAQANFSAVQTYSANPMPSDLAAATELSQGTMKLPRDLLTMAAFGTLIQVTLKDGTTYYSARLVTKQVQVMLDQVTNIPGSIMFRTAEEWVGLAAGPSGDVLTSQGPGNAPAYLPASGGGGGAAALLGLPAGPFTAIDASGTASKAMNFIPGINVEINAVYMLHDDAYGGTYECRIFNIPGGATSHVLGTEVARTSSVIDAAPHSWANWLRLPFTTAIPLVANHTYAFVIVRTDGSGTSPVALLYNTQTYPPASAPITSTQNSGLASNNPVAGNTMTAGSSPYAQYGIGFEWNPSP